jgi:hypothetical protein
MMKKLRLRISSASDRVNITREYRQEAGVDFLTVYDAYYIYAFKWYAYFTIIEMIMYLND